MEEKQHGPIGPVICAAFGFIASAITIVGWFGVTPDMVGAKAASLFRVAAPFLEALFGFLTGWSLRGIRESRRVPSIMETVTTDEPRKQSNADAFKREQNLEKKALAVAAHRNGGYLNVRPTTLQYGNGELLLLGYPQFFHAEPTGITSTRLVLDPWLADTFRSYPELLSSVDASTIAAILPRYKAE